MNIAIHCENLTKSYDVGGQKVTALNNVNLTIKLGELMMLVGPSGCGKTTLISVIAGILDQDSGVCELFGENLLTMKSKDKLRFRAEKIGFVFQAFNLLPSLNAAENVAVPLIINGAKWDVAKRKAIDVLERVAIARALIHSPKLIVCDEPTSALDHASGHNVMNLLKEMALHKDRALVIVSHDSRIFSFADRIAEMDDGHILQMTVN